MSLLSNTFSLGCPFWAAVETWQCNMCDCAEEDLLPLTVFFPRTASGAWTGSVQDSWNLGATSWTSSRFHQLWAELWWSRIRHQQRALNPTQGPVELDTPTSVPKKIRWANQNGTCSMLVETAIKLDFQEIPYKPNHNYDKYIHYHVYMHPIFRLLTGFLKYSDKAETHVNTFPL